LHRDCDEILAPRGALLFDLDGTLVDSLPDLAASLNRVLVDAGLPEVAAETYRSFVGDGAKAMLERGFAHYGHAVPTGAFERFLATYEARVAYASRPFPGVTEALPQLRAQGWRLGVCTNKPERLSRLLLQGLGLAPHFAAIAGGETFARRKPDPLHLTGTLGLMGHRNGAAAMIGDSRNDIVAAKAAGLPAIAVTWGYGAVRDLGADAVIGSMSELPAALSRLFPG